VKLQELTKTFSICKLEPNAEIPTWAKNGSFFSITKTVDELSIICEQSLIPTDITSENDWMAFRVVGNLDFSLTGILASIANPLAEEKISIFAISTFDTDFVLVQKIDWPRARKALENAKFTFD